MSTESEKDLIPFIRGGCYLVTYLQWVLAVADRVTPGGDQRGDIDIGFRCHRRGNDTWTKK